MKRTPWIMLLVGTLILGCATITVAQPYGRGDHGQMMGPGYGGPGGAYGDDYEDEGWYCPWCGQGRGYGGYGRGRGMMGPGMMGPEGRGRGMMGRGMRGRGMGPGMMGPGYGQGRQGYGWDDRYGENTDPLSQDQARLLVENYLRNRGNPNLKLGELTEEEGYYEASILTKEGSLVDKLHVDKQTGWFRSAYDR